MQWHMQGQNDQPRAIVDWVEAEGTDHHATKVALQYMTTLM